MKDKLIQIRADAEFLSKLKYLQLINGFKSISETIRKIVEKEWRKERVQGEWIDSTETTWTPSRKCSICGEVYLDVASESKINLNYFNYCPNCGAKMKNIY